MVNVVNLTKTFDDFIALDDVSIDVNLGSIYGLIGPNGAGKTTLIKHLAGYYRQDSGVIKINEKNVYENNEVKKRIIYIPDDLYFYPRYNLMNMKNFYKSIYEDFDEDRFESLKKIFNIPNDKNIAKFSKGMKKQVSFMLGICCKPDVYLLDEPVDGLDPIARKKVWSLLLQDVADREVSVVISSHNLRELEDICDTVAIMDKGKIKMECEVDDLRVNIHKVQTVIDKSDLEKIKDEFEVLEVNMVGSVSVIIIRGKLLDIEKKFLELESSLFDILPLTLEEIFIYEVGGFEDEFKKVLL